MKSSAGRTITIVFVKKMPFQKGNKIWLGRKRTERERINLKKIVSDSWKNKETREKRIIALKASGIRPPSRIGYKHTKEARAKMSLSKRGRNVGHKNWNWNGGITGLYIKIRNCFLYRQWRSDIFTRDNYVCQKCNKRGGLLEADHYPKTFRVLVIESNIKSLEDAISHSELWNINNGRTLCRNCHRGKGMGHHHRHPVEN